MILIFSSILAGIIIGVGGSALVVAFREMWNDDEPSEFELTELMADIQTDGTPFLSEIERHKQAHLKAMGGHHGTDGLRGSDTERDHTGIA